MTTRRLIYIIAFIALVTWSHHGVTGARKKKKAERNSAKQKPAQSQSTTAGKEDGRRGILYPNGDGLPASFKKEARAGVEAFEMGQYKEAVQRFHAADTIQYDPGNAQNAAIAAMKMKEWKIALQFLGKRVKRTKQTQDIPFEVWAWTGDCLLQIKDHQKAKLAWQQALAANRNHADATFKLGYVHQMLDEHREAIDVFTRAEALNPSDERVLERLGLAYESVKDWKRAKKTYNKLRKLNAKSQAALMGLASVARATGDTAAAEELTAKLYGGKSYGDFIAQGNADFHAKAFRAAVASYEQAVRLDPSQYQGHVNLAAAYQGAGELDKAIEISMATVERFPKVATLLANIGAMLHQRGGNGASQDNQDAVRYLRRAVELDPTHKAAWHNLASLYRMIGAKKEAIETFEKLQSIAPDDHAVALGLGTTYAQATNYSGAVAQFKRVLDQDPNNVEAFCKYTCAAQHVCDWSADTAAEGRLADLLEVQVRDHQKPCISPMQSAYFALPPKTLIGIAHLTSMEAVRRIVQMQVQPMAARDLPAHRKPPRGKLRLGLVSYDFRTHPVGKLIQAGLVGLQSSLVDVTCYSLYPVVNEDDITTVSIKKQCDKWVQLGNMGLKEAIAQIRKDRIHVAMDLMSHSPGQWPDLFVARIAPVQVTHWGFLGTSGADYLDYIVGDRIVSPPHLSQYYSERIVYHPQSMYISDFPDTVPAVRETRYPDTHKQRHEVGLREDAFVFCEFNRLEKIDPHIFATWMSILKRSRNAVFWILRFPPEGIPGLITAAKQHGINPDERFIFTDKFPNGEHLARESMCDLFLDTPRYNAAATGVDVLYAGVPIIAMPRQTMSSRSTATLLHAVGLGELVVSSLQQYEDLAVALAGDHTRYADIRKRLEDARDAKDVDLWNRPKWKSSLVAMLEQLWEVRASWGDRHGHIFT